METLQSFPPNDISKVKELFVIAKQTTNTKQNQSNTVLLVCRRMTQQRVKFLVIIVSHQPKPTVSSIVSHQ